MRLGVTVVGSHRGVGASASVLTGTSAIADSALDRAPRRRRRWLVLLLSDRALGGIATSGPATVVEDTAIDADSARGFAETGRARWLLSEHDHMPIAAAETGHSSAVGYKVGQTLLKKSKICARAYT